MSETTLAEPLDTSWMQDGLCTNEDPAIWWIDPETDNALMREKKTRAAKRICESCPVRLPCLIWGLLEADQDHWSVLGATTHRERIALRKKLGWGL